MEQFVAVSFVINNIISNLFFINILIKIIFYIILAIIGSLILLVVVALIYIVGVHFHLIEPFPHISSFFEAARFYPNYLIIRSGGI